MSTETPPPLDVVPPAQIAQLVETVGVKKASAPALQLLTLAVLAGAFIAFGAMFYTVVVTGSGIGFGPTRLLGSLAFSTGLVLVVIGGAELFTGNSLIVMACADGKVGLSALARNWAIVWFGNLIGALGTAALVHLAGVMTLDGGAVGETARSIAEAKVGLSAQEAFLRGVLCNTLVCLAVWMTFAAHSVSGKVLAILFPVAAFVTLGFEHSVANMYLLPIGALQQGATSVSVGVSAGAIIANLFFVTLGNIVGGGGFVALVYWLVYLRPRESPGSG